MATGGAIVANAQSGSRSGCSHAQLSRRLDLMEAKVLSNWHEFLVHRQEVQIKFQELFSASRPGTPRSKGGVSLHLEDLDRRIAECERRTAEVGFEGREHVKNQIAALTADTSDMKISLEQELRRQTAEASEVAVGIEQQLWKVKAEAFKSAEALEAVIEKKGNVADIAETREALSAFELRFTQDLQQVSQVVHGVDSELDQLRCDCTNLEAFVKSNFEDRIKTQLKQTRDEASQSIASLESFVKELVTKKYEESRTACTAIEARLIEKLSLSREEDRSAMELSLNSSISRNRESSHADMETRLSTRLLKLREEFRADIDDAIRNSALRNASDVERNRDRLESFVREFVTKRHDEVSADIESRLSEKISLSREEYRSATEASLNSSLLRNRDNNQADMEVRLNTRLLKFREELRADIDDSVRNNALRNRNEAMDFARTLEKEIRSLEERHRSETHDIIRRIEARDVERARDSSLVKHDGRSRDEAMDLARTMEKEIRSLEERHIRETNDIIRRIEAIDLERIHREVNSDFAKNVQVADSNILEAHREAARAFGAVSTLEGTLETSNRKLKEEWERRISDLHDAFENKHSALENRIKTELAACSDGARIAAARIGERWSEQLGVVDGKLIQVRADAAQAISDTQRFAELLSIETSNRTTSLNGVTETMHEAMEKWVREVVTLGDGQNSLMNALQDLRDGRASADSEFQTILSEVRSGASRHASELANLHFAVQDFSQRLAPIEATVSAANNDANIARADARTALSMLHKAQEDFDRRFRESLIPSAVRNETSASEEAANALSKAADAERIAREVMFGWERAESQTQKSHHDLHLEQRTLKYEVDEYTRRLGALERGVRDSSRSDGRLNDLANVVEKIAAKIESGHVPARPDSPQRTEPAFTKVDVATTVERLSREVRQSYEKAESSLRRTQDDVARRLADFQEVNDVRWEAVSRSSEQLRVTEGAQRNELWRELRELRGNIGELRLRSGTTSTPRDLSAFGSRFTGVGKVS